jgi:hypothetical protein
MDLIDALNEPSTPALTREEMIEQSVDMLSRASQEVKKELTIYLYESGCRLQDSSRGCMIGARSLSDTMVVHIHNTLLHAAKNVISIGEIPLE